MRIGIYRFSRITWLPDHFNHASPEKTFETAGSLQRNLLHDCNVFITHILLTKDGPETETFQHVITEFIPYLH